MKYTLFSVVILLYSSLVHADFLEVLSQGSSRLWGAQACSYQSGPEVLAATEESRKCIQSQGHEGLTRDAKNILHVARRATESIDQKAENEFFAALGLQHASELNCSADFATSIAADDEKALQARQDIATKIKTARAAKQRLISLTNELSTNSSLSRRVCEDAQNLKPSPIEVEVRGQDVGYEICKQILETRTSLDVVKRLIPLGGAPDIHGLVDKYINAAEGDDAEKMTGQLDALIKKAYTETQSRVKQSAQSLAEQAVAVPLKMDRATKKALLSDPLVTRKVIESGGEKNRALMESMACRADQRYGRGADDLDKTLLIGSVVVSTGAGLALRASAYAARFAVGAQNIRAAGYLSVNASSPPLNTLRWD